MAHAPEHGLPAVGEDGLQNGPAISDESTKVSRTPIIAGQSGFLTLIQSRPCSALPPRTESIAGGGNPAGQVV